MRGIIHAAHQNLLNVLPNRLFTTTNGAREGAEKGREYIEGAVGVQAAPLTFLTRRVIEEDSLRVMSRQRPFRPKKRRAPARNIPRRAPSSFRRCGRQRPKPDDQNTWTRLAPTSAVLVVTVVWLLFARFRAFVQPLPAPSPHPLDSVAEAFPINPPRSFGVVPIHTSGGRISASAGAQFPVRAPERTSAGPSTKDGRQSWKTASPR